ncbi:MAG: undecaprenyl-diphosphate phosphatase [Candidatus Cloacimonetes bacterium]|nr:undecaprenyl-diphosphate phosphatase [Candidatus Cloacimonadota bacterium]
MSWIKSILLGVIQGLTEFLPVSSSGHLAIFDHFLDASASISFDIFVHLGTLLAVLIYFREDVRLLVVSLFTWQKPEDAPHRRLMLLLFVVTVVTAIPALLLKDKIEVIREFPRVVALILIANGFILLISDRQEGGEGKAEKLPWLKAVYIGIAQFIAVVPGISRSGSTITAGIFGGLTRSEAARFSFLLSIPAILGANIFAIRDISTLEMAELKYYLVAFVAASVSGYLVISLLIRLVQKRKLKYFAYYCWAFALITLVLITIQG